MMETTLKTGTRRAIGILLGLAMAFAVIPALSQSVHAIELQGEAYAVFNSEDGSLTFFRDEAGKYEDKQEDGTKTYFAGFETLETINTSQQLGWIYADSSFNIRNKINTVNFQDRIKPLNTSCWFYNLTNLTQINGIENLDTSSVTSMWAMFDGCTSLADLDVSRFDTSNVTRMLGMFENCKKLTGIDVSKFDTSKVENFQSMFEGCTNLADLDVSHFDTSNATSLNNMFKNCTNLTSLDVSKFDTSNVQRMVAMFSGCTGLTDLNLGHFDTSNVTDMGGTFRGCTNIRTTMYMQKIPDYVYELFKNAATGDGAIITLKAVEPAVTSEKISELIKDNHAFGYQTKGNVVNGGADEFVPPEPPDTTYLKARNAAVRELWDTDVSIYDEEDAAAITELVETAVDRVYATETKPEIDEIMDEMRAAIANWVAAQGVKNLFNELPAKDDVKASHEGQITAARTAYEDLTDKQKALIHADDLQKLVDAETGLSELGVLKAALQKLVNEANAEDLSIYTDATVEPFTQAIGAAKGILSDTADPTKREVDAARTALENAIRGLKTKETQALEDAKAELGALIGNAQALDSDLLTDESKAALETAIGDAQDVYDNPNATKDDLDAAIEALNQAIEGLNGLADYREAAEKELREYKNHDDYSEAGKAALNDIVNAAVAEINMKTSEADIDAVVTKAKADMDAVKTKAEEEFDQAKEDLDKAVKDAEDKLKDKDKYTDDTVKDLEDALGKAKETANNPDATKDDLEKAKKDLDDAVKNLKEKDGSDPSKDPNKMGEDGTALGKGASEAAADNAITNMPNDNDPPGSKIMPLKLKSKKQTKSSVKITWSGAAGAVKYVVYGNECGSARKMQKITTVTGGNYNVSRLANGSKLRKGKYHKFIVVALDSKNMVVSTSKVIHVVTKGGKNGNHKKVKVNNAKKFKKGLKQGKSLKIKGKAVGKKVKKHVKLRYESSNSAVATVSASGKVKAVGKGSATIIVYAQNGVSKNVKVKVK